MHAIEKILAKNSGRAEVRTGEIVTAKVDFAEINDLYLQTVYSFYEMGGEKVWEPTIERPERAEELPHRIPGSGIWIVLVFRGWRGLCGCSYGHWKVWI